jgi:hypothetical protein
MDRRHVGRDDRGALEEMSDTLGGSGNSGEGRRKPGPHLVERGGIRKVFGKIYLRYALPGEREVEHE